MNYEDTPSAISSAVHSSSMSDVPQRKKADCNLIMGYNPLPVPPLAAANSAGQEIRVGAIRNGEVADSKSVSDSAIC
jgi:hypothetical protein